MNNKHILITTWERTDIPIPEGVFSDDIDLHENIVKFLTQQNIEYIFLDRNIAICKEVYYGAFLKEDIELI